MGSFQMIGFSCCFALLLLLVVVFPVQHANALASSSSSSSGSPPDLLSNKQHHHKFVILGGTGQIGTAVAAHLRKRSPSCDIVLVGRRESTAQAAIQDVLRMSSSGSSSDQKNISFALVQDIWNPTFHLQKLFQEATCVIHTAGPYSGQTPTVLDAAIQAQVPVYVDVSDPLPFLEQSLQRYDQAVASGTTALCAAGAFPGMSNVLAMEAAAHCKKDNDNDQGNTKILQDVRFHYFTKGLGGSGTINLYITNLGFGDPMTQFEKGQRREFTNLSGKLLGQVDFFISHTNQRQEQLNAAQTRVGTQQVFAWPFPEAATVAEELQIQGSSSAAMGTAPDIWNSMLGLLVQVIPRTWWRNKRFSKFLADFSQPLVLITDAIMKQTTTPRTSHDDDTSNDDYDNDSIGETHAMRIDVTTATTSSSTPSIMTSIVQAHESFRQCVGQSCAEFALDNLDHPCPGVYLPEQRYRQESDRRRIIDKLTSTPGTFCYSGPVAITPTLEDGGRKHLPVYPTNIDHVVERAMQHEHE